MESTAEHRAVKNTVVGIISFIVSFLQSILIVPLILNNWGNAKYGNWLALFAGFTLLQTLDLGHQSYIGNEINILYHKDKEELRRVLSSSLLIAWFIGFIEVIVTIYLIYTGNLSSFLGINTIEHELSYSILSLMIMWFIFGSVSGILIKLLIPAGMLYEQQWISIIIRFIQFIVLLIIVLLKGSILSAAIFYSIVQSILTILTVVYLKNKLPDFYPWWKYGDYKTAIKNFLQSIVLTFNNIIQQLSINGLILFVSNYYQVIQVPIFTTIRTLTNTAGGVTNIVISAVNPDIVKYYSKGEDKKLFLSLTTNLFISGLIVNLALIISLFFIEPLYYIWTNGHLDFNKNLYLFLAAGISFSNFGIGIVNYLFSVNKLKQFSYIVISKSAFLFLLAYLFLHKKDLSTIGIGVAISEFISSVFLATYLLNKDNKNFFKEDRKKFFIIALLPPMIICCLAILSYYNYLTNQIILIALIITIMIYYFSWKMIQPEVKERIYIIINKYFKIKKS